VTRNGARAGAADKGVGLVSYMCDRIYASGVDDERQGTRERNIHVLHCRSHMDESFYLYMSPVTHVNTITQ